MMVRLHSLFGLLFPQWMRKKFLSASRFKRVLILLAISTVLPAMGFGTLVAVQAQLNQELYVNQAAETLRTIFGQNTVSRIEYQIFMFQQKFRKPRHSEKAVINQVVASEILQLLPDITGPAIVSDPPPNVEPLIQYPILQDEGKWRPTEKIAGMWRTQIRPNPQLSDQYVDLVAINPRLFQLSFVPGTEITHDAKISSIPPAERSSIVAVFNGGFRWHSGQRKAGILYNPLQLGEGSVILNGDTIQICQWLDTANAQFPTADVRQNLTLLLDKGQIENKLLQFLADKHLDFPTYRSGIGLTADHCSLIFAGGADLRPVDLATALRLAKCRTAIHLDQNHGNVFFDTVKESGTDLIFKGLDPALHLAKHQKVLIGSNRDFFYLSQRSRPAPDKKKS